MAAHPLNQTEPLHRDPPWDDILAGYERSISSPRAGSAFDRWCWRVVINALASLGDGAEADTYLRVARYRALHGSLHGLRIGATSASTVIPPAGAKGKARAERELHLCLEAAYEKWLAALTKAALAER